jgi:ABC-type enterochelin transport system permease subunit
MGHRCLKVLFTLLEFFTIAFLSYELINGLNYWFSHLGDFAFVFRPDWGVLFVPPCMACLAVVLLLHDRVKACGFRRLLGRSVPESWQWLALLGLFGRLL